MRNIKKLTRRHLIKTAAAAGVTLPLFNIISAGAEANEKLKAGFIGMGRMNYFTLRTFMGATKVLAVCDVDTTRRTHALETVNKHYGNQDCKAYIDYRDLLAREDIDLVVIGTPDHWHATITIDAARVGKDIYCEKPLTHDIEEAIRVMQEVEKAGVVLQTGSHQRSQSEFRIAAELVRNNVAGKVKKITSSFWGPGQPCNLGEEKMEPGLDWNRWLGPAPMRPYHSTLSPRGVHDIFPNWRAYREFGGGGVCDMGAHHLDIIQWAMEMDKSGPVKALPNADLSNDWGARLVYANGIEVVRSNGFHVDFECENGRIQASRGQFRLELDGKSIHQFVEREDGSLTRALVFTERDFLKNASIRLPKTKGGHITNFLNCVKSRQKPIAHVEAGARSSVCCHLMNLAYYQKQPIHWDPKGLKFSDDSCDPTWLVSSRRNYLKA